MKIALISLGPWAPWAPSYALGLLTSIVRHSTKTSLDTYDLNIDIHHDVAIEEHKYWGDEYGGSWDQSDFVNAFIARNQAAINQWIKRISDHHYSLVCFSVHSGSRLYSKYFAGKLKELQPARKIAFGGPDCFRSEYGVRYLEDPNIDYVCVGEGDRAFPSFLNELMANGLEGEIKTPGIVYRNKTRTGLIDNGDPVLIDSLDSLPLPDYSWAELKKYTIPYRVTTMTSRGCINRCTFCSEGMNFKKYRTRSPENVISELKMLISMFPNAPYVFVNFNDSLINGNMERFEKLLDLIIENRMGIVFEGMALIRKEMDEHIFQKMKDAGCTEVMWGLESGSDTVLKLMGKRFTIETAKTIIENCAKFKIKQCANIIVGFPGEQEKEFIETCLFIIDYGKYFEVIGLPAMMIRPNSIVYLMPDKFGILDNQNESGWRSKDLRNIPEIRNQRRELLQKIMGTKLFHQGKN
jgi:anaerobic magnesium-protoporphyrin IX monomethyl ester cyclase